MTGRDAPADAPRPAAGGFALTRREGSIALTLFVLVLGYGLLIMGGHHYSSDGFVTFQSSRILLTEGTLFFEPPLRWGDQIIYTSKYGIGMTLAYLVYLIPLQYLRPEYFAQVFDLTLAYDQRLLYNDLYRYASTLNAFVVAGIAGCLYLLARELGLSRRWAAATALSAALASPLAVYARLDFSQPLTALCLLAALWLWLRALNSATHLPALGAGLVMAAGVLIRFDFVLVAVPGLGLVAAHAALTGSPRQRARLLGGLGIAGLAVGAAVGGGLAINALKLGSPFAFGYPDAWNTTLWPTLTGLVGHLVSPGAGLLWYFPLSALLVVAVGPLLARHPVLGLACLVISVSHLGLYSVWRNWPGGYAWGPRFLVPLVPLMTLAISLWAAESKHRGRRWWLLGGVGVSWLVSLNGILFSFLHLFSTCNCLNQGPVGSERFTAAGSNLIAGWFFPKTWDAASVVAAFDLLWLQAMVGHTNSAVAIVVFGGLMAAAAVGLARLLQPEPTAPAARDG